MSDEKVTKEAPAAKGRDNINKQLGDVLRYGKRIPDGESSQEGRAGGQDEGSGKAGEAGDGKGDAHSDGGGEGGSQGKGDPGGEAKGAGEGQQSDGEGAGDAGAAAGEGAGDDGADGLTLRDLAAALDVDPADVYKVRIPMGEQDGKPVFASLGALKDAYRTAEQFEADKAAEREARREWEHSRNADLRDIAAIVDVLPQVPPQVAAAIDQRNKHLLERERRLMLAAIPEWKDPARLTAERDGMAKLAAQYGFDRSEFEGITDHRLARFVRDFWMAQERESGAAKKLRELRQGGANKPGQRAGSNGGGAHLKELRDRARKSGDRADRIAAVRELLKGR